MSAYRQLRRADLLKLLSEKTYQYALTVGGIGEIKVPLRELGDWAGLLPWNGGAKSRAQALAKEIPMVRPLQDFVAEWTVDSEHLVMRWEVRDVDEALH